MHTIADTRTETDDAGLSDIPEFEDPGTGKKRDASSRCCSADCFLAKNFSVSERHRKRGVFHTLNATKPTIIPAAKKANAMINQTSPQPKNMVN